MIERTDNTNTSNSDTAQAVLHHVPSVLPVEPLDSASAERQNLGVRYQDYITKEEAEYIAYGTSQYMLETYKGLMCHTTFFDHHGIEHFKSCTRHSEAPLENLTAMAPRHHVERYGRDIYDPLSYNKYHEVKATKAFQRIFKNHLNRFHEHTKNIEWQYIVPTQILDKPVGGFGHMFAKLFSPSLRAMSKNTAPLHQTYNLMYGQGACFEGQLDEASTRASIRSVAATALWTEILSTGIQGDVFDVFKSIALPERHHKLPRTEWIAGGLSFLSGNTLPHIRVFNMFLMATLHEAGKITDNNASDTPYEWQQKLVKERFVGLFQERAGLARRLGNTYEAYYAKKYKIHEDVKNILT